MAKPKTINCKWCGMGHAPHADGNHWIMRSIMPDARFEPRECAYHKAGTVSPIQRAAHPPQDEIAPCDDAELKHCCARADRE